MAIDMNPKVGRIVICRAASTEFFPWFMPGGTITKISGQRIYYTDASGKEKFTHDYAAVCDSNREAKKLLDFTAAGRKRFEALKAELIRGRMDIHPAAYYEGEYAPGGPKATKQTPAPAPEPTPSRVRRVRAG